MQLHYRCGVGAHALTACMAPFGQRGYKHVQNSVSTAKTEICSAKQIFKTITQEYTYTWFGLLYNDTNSPLNSALFGREGAFGSYRPPE